MTALRVGLFAMCAMMAAAFSGSPIGTRAMPAEVASRPPVLAYYYIWFDETSWDRAKIDYPTLGKYSSDDRDVMRQHILWAKEAGIDGFIVSWKSTAKLNARLGQLVEIADAEHFKLAIIYEGLNFERDPLPVDTIAHDLDVFLADYASNDAFKIFDKPLVIWSGTWKFSTDEIASVGNSRRDRMALLASEKGTAGYERLGGLVDGNAYYWSSVNPETFPDYAGKLQAFASSVHADGGLWIAPAAPGFNARLVGGTSVVSRDAGQTLRREMAAAREASPDAIGLISWNEFSENTYIEPSEQYGRQYLDLTRSTIRAQRDPSRSTSQDTGVDSSGPEGRSLTRGVGVLIAMMLLAALALGFVTTRRTQGRKADL